ncbi:MAG: T9SS type A sorting domain-containing protein [Brumimicrobium sp.]
MKSFHKKTIILGLILLTNSVYKVNAQLSIAAIQEPNIILIDPANGQITDPSFIDLSSLNPSTPKAIIQVDNEIWISDQIADRIDRFDLGGQHLGEIGGQVANGGLDNIKGMAVIGNNEVWVTNAGTQNGAPGDAIVRIDFNGNILGNISTGSDSSFDIIDNGAGEAYISYIGTNTRIERMDYTGTVLGNIVAPSVVNFIQQIDITSTGSVLAGVFSNSTNGNSSGVYRFSETNGNIIDYWSNSGVRGTMELDDGNILWSNSSGISILDENTGNSTSISSGSSQYFGKINFDCTSNPTSAPTGNATQNYCEGATVDDLTVTGSNIQWYDDPTAGNLLASSDLLVDGESYYASQTVASCESDTRFEVNVTINDPSAPTGVATQDFCIGSTVNHLTATGSVIQWYDDPTSGSLLSASDILVAGNYYATQTISGCESSTRFEVVVTIDDPAVPTGDQTQIFCDSAKVNDLQATGSDITWYDDATGGNILLSTDNLVDGESYYASQTISGCEGQDRFEVVIAIDAATPVTGDANQTVSVVNPNDATLDDLVVSPSTITWYGSEADALSESNPLPSSTILSDNETYYAVNSENGCQSIPFEVTVTIEVTASLESFVNDALEYYPNPTTNILNIKYSKPISEYNVSTVLGQSLISKKTNTKDIKIDLTSLPPATYFIKIVSENNSKTIKIVKRN